MGKRRDLTCATGARRWRRQGQHKGKRQDQINKDDERRRNGDGEADSHAHGQDKGRRRETERESEAGSKELRERRQATVMSPDRMTTATKESRGGAEEARS